MLSHSIVPERKTLYYRVEFRIQSVKQNDFDNFVKQNPLYFWFDLGNAGPVESIGSSGGVEETNCMIC